MKVIHFLGGIYFAIFLIAAVAIFVIAGTFLESWTSSHRFAAYFTYQNPLFIALIWGFFLNILISALLRWPFKSKHIPFLTTHLGLLMIITGTLIKSYYGTQGAMTLLEGGGSQEILLPETYAIQVTNRKGVKDEYPLTRKLVLKNSKRKLFPELDIQLVGFAPHTHTTYESWIKNDKVFIQGLKPFEVYAADNAESLPVSSKVNMGKQTWDLIALHTENEEALLPRLLKHPHPTLSIVNTPDATRLLMFDSRGVHFQETYPKKAPHTLAVYDRGFGGYYTIAKIFPAASTSYETYAKAFGLADDTITLESPLRCRCIPQSPSTKLEENIPQITFRIRAGDRVEFITLPYDPQAFGIKWPVLGGNYLVRFQPEFKELPYHVRLRQARQINYASSAQPFSYESDLLIHSKKDQQAIDKTISMNNVHETWDGYRFYLSNIASTAQEGESIKRIQIIVNHDPAKYWLTYPGAFILSLGILLLFWLRPYKEKKP